MRLEEYAWALPRNGPPLGGIANFERGRTGFLIEGRRVMGGARVIAYIRRSPNDIAGFYFADMNIICMLRYERSYMERRPPLSFITTQEHHP